MILTLGEGYDSHDGTALPMFSRSGKSTTSQYLAFQQGNKKTSDVRTAIPEDLDEDEEQDLGNFLGERKP